MPGNHLGQQSNGYRWPYGPVSVIFEHNKFLSRTIVFRDVQGRHLQESSNSCLRRYNVIVNDVCLM